MFALVGEAVTSALRLRDKDYALIVLSVSTVVSGILEFISEWIWDPVWAIAFFIGVYFVDSATAIWVSIKRGEGFKTNKWKTTLITLSAIWFIFTVMHNFPKLIDIYLPIEDAAVPFRVIPGLLFLYLLTRTFGSAVKNFVLLGYMRNDFAKFVYKYIDVYKNTVDDVLSDKK